MRRVCIFAGSSAGVRPIYTEVARQLGTELAQRGIGLVYGGGSVGLMGAAAEAALAGGGEVIGVIPRAMAVREIAHEGLTELRVVETMHERKAQMAALAEGFVALPGGLGTFDELFEMLTWAQLGLHEKPVGLLNTDAYFAPLLNLIIHATDEGFVPERDSEIVLVDTRPDRLLDRMRAHLPAPATRRFQWITPDQV